MKKNLLLFIFFATVGFSLSAQDVIEISPSPVNTLVDAAIQSDVPGHATMTSHATATRIYRWEREIISMTEGWGTAVCDKNACYFPNVDSKIVSFDSEEEGDLIVHVYPNGIEGAAEIKICVTDTLDTSIKTCNTYFFTPSITATTTIKKKQIRLFPNPTTGGFEMTPNTVVETLYVYDLTGRIVKELNATGGEQFDISNLPSGNYMIQLIGKDGSTLITRLLQKK